MLRARRVGRAAARPPCAPRSLRSRPHKRSAHAQQCRAAAVEDALESADGELCAPAFVTHEQTPRGTKLNVRVVDYQGLLHVISWVLKGLEVRVRSADMVIDDGMADDSFLITTLSGKPLSDERAADIAERVREMVTYCTPTRANKPVMWRNGPVHVCNKMDAECTVVTVQESTERIGFLLEIVSVLCGIGVDVKAAKVHTCVDCEDDPRFQEMFSSDCIDPGAMRDGRVIQLKVQTPDGAKLPPQTVEAVLFTLGLVLGQGTSDTKVPGVGRYAIDFA